MQGGRQAGEQRKENAQSVPRAQRGQWNLTSFLTDLWLHGLHGPLTGNGIGYIPTGQFTQNYLCVYLL